MDIAITALTSLIITVLITPVVIKIARKYGLVDDPAQRPHPAHTQDRIIPRAGGLPIYIAILVSSLIFIPFQKYLTGIFAGTTLLLITGLLDDKLVKFSPYIRLVLLFIAAILAVSAGIGVSFINNPFYGLIDLPQDWNSSIWQLDQLVYTVNFLGEHSLVLLADIFALIWIVTLTQIVNWSKGVDGQMPGITLIAAVVLGLLSLKFYNQGDLSQLNHAKLSFIVAGASLGFLFFNWHPSRILPGFSGSTILAYLLAILAILSTAKVATALLVLAIPTIDFIYAILRRLKAGKSPVWGDRGHLHHRLLDLGWSHQKISLFYMAGSAILGAVALLINTESKLFAGLVVAAVFTGFILWINSFGDLSNPQDPDNG